VPISGGNRCVTSVIKKGYVSHAGGKVRQFIAEKPQKIFLREKTKISLFEQALPGFIALASESKFKPSVRFFTALEGMKTVYEESLLQPVNSEILAIGNAQSVEESIPHFKNWYIDRRKKARIHVRALTSHTAYGIGVVRRDKEELRHTRLISAELCPQNIEIDIYGNKVTMVSFVEKELIGIIIESNVIANALRQMFEIIWLHAQEIKL